MLIRAGYNLAFECPSATPMLLLINVVPDREPDLRSPVAVQFHSTSGQAVPWRMYRDGFNNVVTRIVAPPGRLTISADFLVQDSGLHDPVVPDAVAMVAFYRVHRAERLEQVRQALANVVAVLAEAGATPAHIVRMTWYLTDKREYLARGREIGRAYRDLIGDYTVAMSAVQVAALMEDRAQVEIEVSAVVA